MRLTPEHLHFWHDRHPPSWAARATTRMYKASMQQALHRCINAHADVRLEHTDAQNLLVILRSMRQRRADLRIELARIAARPDCAIRPERRAAYAAKWLRRLNHTTTHTQETTA